MEALTPESPPPGDKAPSDPPNHTIKETAQDVSVIEPGPRGRALAIEYILMELFSYLKLVDLMECRLVNKVWNQIATEAIGQNSPMVHFGRNQMADLIQFMKTVDQCDLKRNKFAVDSAILLGCSPKQKLMLPEFFETVAPAATHLKITLSADAHFLFPTTMRRPDKNIEYPNLQYLEINSLEDKRRFLNGFVIDIMGHAPKLESVSIRTETAGTLDDVFKVVPWHQVSHLELKGQMKRQHFQELVDLGTTLHLKSLKLELNGMWSGRDRGDLHTYDIGNFLQTQSDTLETLKLHFRGMPLGNFIREFPRFSKLRNVEICEDAWSAVIPIPFRRSSVTSFQEKFPVLESFHISQFKWIDFSIFIRREYQDDIIPLDTVKELKLDLDLEHLDDKINEIFARRLIQKTASIFPGVTKLGLPAFKPLSMAIEEENVWKDLEELTLFCDHNSSTDNALMKNPGQAPAESDVFNVFNFVQKIKTLNFDTGYESRVVKPCCLSDMTCRSVLLQLPNLKHVNLAALNGHHVSEAVISEMREKFEVVCSRKNFSA